MTEETKENLLEQTEITKEEVASQAMPADEKQVVAAEQEQEIVTVTAEPTSMEQLAEEMLSLPQFEVGQAVTGVVSSLEEKHAKVAIDNCEFDCIIPVRELSISRSEQVTDAVSIGDEVQLVVIKVEENAVILSKRAVDLISVWESLVTKFERGEVFEATVTEVVKGGLVVDIGLRGFIPASMVDDKYVEDLSIYQDQSLSLKIMEMDEEKSRVILSHREVLREQKVENEKAVMTSLTVGAIVEGTVARLANFGAFVDIGGVEGLVHVSQISHQRVNEPSECLTAGDVIQVKILSIDKEAGRISLSIKDTLPGPWEANLDQLKVGQVFEGTVKRLVDFGAFVEVLPGVEGLVHISQIAHEHIKTPHEVLSEGSTVNVKVLKVDNESQKLSLSIKELLENPEAEITDFELPEESTGFSIGELFADQLKGFKE